MTWLQTSTKVMIEHVTDAAKSISKKYKIFADVNAYYCTTGIIFIGWIEGIIFHLLLVKLEKMLKINEDILVFQSGFVWGPTEGSQECCRGLPKVEH